MQSPLRFKDKNGFPYERDAADVLWGETAGQHCILHFGKDDWEYWSYSLAEFHRRVWNLNTHRKLDRFIVAKVKEIKNRTWLKALFYNGIILELSRTANTRLKEYLKKHPPADD